MGNLFWIGWKANGNVGVHSTEPTKHDLRVHKGKVSNMMRRSMKFILGSEKIIWTPNPRG
jgi:hypothetical protein